MFQVNRVHFGNNIFNSKITAKITLIVGSKFTLTFHIGEDDYFVYTGDEGRNFQYQFPHQLNIKDIECVQLWDDIEYVNEIIFRYKQK